MKNVYTFERAYPIPLYLPAITNLHPIAMSIGITCATDYLNDYIELDLLMN